MQSKFNHFSHILLGESPAHCAIATNKVRKHEQSAGASTLHIPVLPKLPEKLRRLLNATYAAHGGAEHMSLHVWRDIEQELERGLAK